MSNTLRLTKQEAQRLIQSSEAGEWWPAQKGLVNARDWLHLNEFPELDDAAAVLLARHRGRLTLDGLRSLSDESAAALSSFAGPMLDLNRLRTLSDSAAESLSKYHGELSLNWVSELSEEAAAALAQHQGELHLDNLNSLPDTSGHLKLLKKLALQVHASTQAFTNVSSLSHASAEILADLPGGVHLNSLISLTPTLAEILARNQTGLLFMELDSLTEDVAQALAKCKGQLWLNVPERTLSDGVAEALAQHPGGSLILLDLDSLTESAAERLADHVGLIQLAPLTKLTDDAARALTRRQGPLIVRGMEDLPASVADILRPHLLVETGD